MPGGKALQPARISAHRTLRQTSVHTQFVNSNLLKPTQMQTTLLSQYKSCILALALSFAASTLSQGQQGISVNFSSNRGDVVDDQLNTGQIAGVVPLANWNNVDSGGNGTLEDLVSASAGFTTADLTWTSGGTYRQPDYSSDTNIDPITANEILMTAFIGDGASATFTLASIPFSQYDLYVYIGRGNFAGASDNALTLTIGSTSVTKYARNKYFDGTFTESNSSVPEDRPVGDYVLFSGLTDSSLSLANASSNQATIHGFQIVAVPEPSTFLAMLGGVAVLGITRRRR